MRSTSVVQMLSKNLPCSLYQFSRINLNIEGRGGNGIKRLDYVESIEGNRKVGNMLVEKM